MVMVVSRPLGRDICGILKIRMKSILVFLILLIFSFSTAFCQKKKDQEAIDNRREDGVTDIQTFQALNNGALNIIQAQQTGVQNSVAAIQQSSNGGLLNQMYTIQEGNLNEVTVGQIGRGNMLLSFQLGYVTSEFVRQQGDCYGFGLGNQNLYEYDDKSADFSINVGRRNKLTFNQNGTNNVGLVFQQGSDNTISVDQQGNNNYMIIYQKGRNNVINGYNQANTSDKILYDLVIQEGEKLVLNATESSKQPSGNTFIQSGSNLQLQVNSGFANDLGGLGIVQTGKNMKVIVDQSFFAFPMK